MCASPFNFLRAGPPPPKVALLPDALFFTRAVPVTAGASAAEAGAQVELALESIAPFPLAQLYYGWFWAAGSETALVFAAYRRRFTSEQTAEWEGAELVVPAFAATLGSDLKPATTVVLRSVEGLTAVHWENGPVPSQVIFQPLPIEATDEDRASVRDELLKLVGGSKTVVELDSPLAADPARSDREIVFRSGDFVSRVPAIMAAALDVRDKADLAALRAARQRDVILWRVTLASAAALALLMIGEIAMLGARGWERNREKLFNSQKPVVDRISGMADLTTRIEELRTKRLLPIEMVAILVGNETERLPPDIQFTRVQADQTRGLYTVFVEGRTSNPPQISVYESALNNLPAVEHATAQISQMRPDQATFTLIVTFKPEALKPSV